MTARAKGSIPDPLAPLVEHIAARVLAIVREELRRDVEGDRLIRADLTGLAPTPRESARKVRRLADAGKLATSKIGKHRFVRAADLAALTQSTRTEPTLTRDASPPANDRDLDGVAALADELGYVEARPRARGRR